MPQFVASSLIRDTDLRPRLMTCKMPASIDRTSFPSIFRTTIVICLDRMLSTHLMVKSTRPRSILDSVRYQTRFRKALILMLMSSCRVKGMLVGPDGPIRSTRILEKSLRTNLQPARLNIG